MAGSIEARCFSKSGRFLAELLSFCNSYFVLSDLLSALPFKDF
jgi:hypothetical protein